MLYLSGCQRVGMNRYQGIGVMLNPATGIRTGLLESMPWAADNGCFAQGTDFDELSWLNWLNRITAHRRNCLFAVIPDVVSESRPTLDRFARIAPEVSGQWPVAMVAQDGLETEPEVHSPSWWGTFDCFFIGGSTEWKLSPMAATLAREAKERGRWLHMGRVNSLKRLEYAASGCDSCDGTYVAFGPDKNLPKISGWLSSVNAQGRLLL